MIGRSLLVLCASFAVSLSSRAEVPVPRFYEYWTRGPEGAGVSGINTSYYEQLFSTRGPNQKFYDATERNFYYAALGDATALRRFLHSSDRNELGAPGEGWTAKMTILVLAFGDDRLSQALRRESKNIREAVGVAVETQLYKDRDRFVRTRALYRFRN
jgi:hypothetical protein